MALSVWWGSNTIGHLFVHRPFFAAPWANRLFSAWLSLVVGMPQTLWRERHLAHHAGGHWAPRLSTQLLAETALVLGLWAALPPAFLLGVYLPGWLGGLALCWLQGHFEHHRGTVSHYGGLYNLIWFNNGYHQEHHLRPLTHWTQMPKVREQFGVKLNVVERIVSPVPALLGAFHRHRKLLHRKRIVTIVTITVAQ